MGGALDALGGMTCRLAASWRVLGLLVCTVTLLAVPASAELPHGFDRCALLTDDDISAHLGPSMGLRDGPQHRRQGVDTLQCRWDYEDDKPHGFTTVSLLVSSGEPGHERFQDPALTEDDRLVALPGIGDEAYMVLRPRPASDEDNVVGLWALVDGSHIVRIDGGQHEPPAPGNVALLTLVVERLPAAIEGHAGSAGPDTSAEPGDNDPREDACDGFASELHGPDVAVQGTRASIEVGGPAGEEPHEHATDWGTADAVPGARESGGGRLRATAIYPDEPGVYDGLHTVTAERDGVTCTATLPFTVEISAGCLAVEEVLRERGYRMELGVTDEPHWGNPEVLSSNPLEHWRERDTFVGTDRVAVTIVPAPDPDFELEYVRFGGTPRLPNAHPGQARRDGWAVASFIFPDRSSTTVNEVLTETQRIVADLTLPPAAVTRLVGAAAGTGIGSAPSCTHRLETELTLHHQPWYWQCYEALGPCRVVRRTDADATWGHTQAVGAYLKDLDRSTSLMPTPVASAGDVAAWVALVAAGQHVGAPGFELHGDIAPRQCIAVTGEWSLEAPPCA